MLGYAHNRQPTVILTEFQRGEKVNAWMCTAVNHDPARVSIKSVISVTSVMLCGFTVLEFIKIRNIRNLMRIYCFGINLRLTSVIISAGWYLSRVPELLHNLAIELQLEKHSLSS